jgi:hypothetical protein
MSKFVTPQILTKKQGKKALLGAIELFDKLPEIREKLKSL